MYEIEDKENRERYQMQRSAARKDWIKNLAIVFLSIMLILTFFSNTIMNYSLPQVATRYVQEGSITPKVRGSGVAEVEDPYSVKAPNGRVIASVNVKAGDDVKKDDVIFELQDSESDELKEARKELALISMTIAEKVVRKELSGNIAQKELVDRFVDEIV